MADLNHLKVDSVPSAFAEWAKKHNELVDLIAAIEGAQGIDIKITSRPRKRLSVPGDSSKKSKLPRGRIIVGIRGGTGSGTSQTVGLPATELHANAGGQTIDIDLVTPNYITTRTDSNGHLTSMSPEGFYLLTSNGRSLNLDGSNVTHSMYIREIEVCNGNAVQHMLILGSAVY